jgi:hypothetical protein
MVPDTAQPDNENLSNNIQTTAPNFHASQNANQHTEHYSMPIYNVKYIPTSYNSTLQPVPIVSTGNSNFNDYNSAATYFPSFSTIPSPIPVHHKIYSNDITTAGFSTYLLTNIRQSNLSINNAALPEAIICAFQIVYATENDCNFQITPVLQYVT